TLVCIQQLLRWRDQLDSPGYSEPPDQTERETTSGLSSDVDSDKPLGGSWLAGIKLVLNSPFLLGICAFILLTATLRTFLYFTQAHIVESAFADPGVRTTLFALMDLSVNVLTIVLQVFITGRLLTKYGVSIVLALIPMYVLLSFTGLSIAPILPVLVAAQVGTRAGNYSITRPGREVLFTLLEREKKYKAKNFIDTVVYRAGDAISGWTFAGLTAIGMGISGIALIALPFTIGWMAIGYILGRRHEQDRRS
ncbi:MAG TPA: MFS transporter, partial [bacterium]|nr:MFS transporter [bacterium]